MQVGGYDFVDLRRPGEGWGQIGEVDLIVVHHSVSDFDIRADNDLDSIMAILRHHEGLGWPGNGYHVNVGDDGTKYLVGDLSSARAHIKYKNGSSWGVCLLGDYTHVQPPPAQIQGAGEAVVALRRHSGKLDMRWAGHCVVADPRSPTACPGDQWPRYRLDLAAAVVEETNRMAEKTLSREQAINIIRAETQRRIDFWTYIFALQGWELPPAF